MSTFWFIVAAILLVLWLRDRQSVAKIEAKRAQLQKEAFSLWNDRTALQKDIEELKALVERVVAERDHANAQLANISNLELLKSELEAAIRALQNRINGYGDEHLLPTSRLLDEMEEQFGFTDPAQSLKEARNSVKRMIKAGLAASSGYAEPIRQQTAVQFIVDAFNGKVDTALAQVKHDNYGKLQQHINDAFALVNLKGKAFRDTAISRDYLNAQLQVLRWAVVVQQLKQQARDEQREMREQMREEEKARKEYERALQQSAREEEMARQAVHQAQQALLQASEAERQKFEERLAMLSEQLRIAEEKGRRALSMAQQTRVGTVYVISNAGSFGEHVFKIGMTRRLEPEDRVRELSDASVPFSFDIHALIKTDDAPTLEKELHKSFIRSQVNKVNNRKEFFRVSLAEIRAEVERRGVEAAWTMAAACTEWRETHALEVEMARDETVASRWSAKQRQLEDVEAS